MVLTALTPIRRQGRRATRPDDIPTIAGFVILRPPGSRALIRFTHAEAGAVWNDSRVLTGGHKDKFAFSIHIDRLEL
jgi:hypothetical protein